MKYHVYKLKAESLKSMNENSAWPQRKKKGLQNVESPFPCNTENCLRAASPFRLSSRLLCVIESYYTPCLLFISELFPYCQAPLPYSWDIHRGCRSLAAFVFVISLTPLSWVVGSIMVSSPCSNLEVAMYFLTLNPSLGTPWFLLETGQPSSVSHLLPAALFHEPADSFT